MKLSADVLRVRNVTLLTSVSEKMHYGSISAVDNINCNTVDIELMSVTRCYSIRWLKIALIMLDAQFKSLKDRSNLGI